MSQENVDIVRRWYEHSHALREHPDPALLSPDLIYRPVANFTESGTCRGLDEFRRFLESFYEAWADDFTITATSVRDYGDAVIARVQFSGHARASGVVSPWRAFSVFWLRDGLITRIEDYADRAEALKAIGLAE